MSKNTLLSIINAPEPIKQNKTIKDITKENPDADKILGDIRTLFESDNKDYYNSIKIYNAFDDNYVEYESNGDKYKTLLNKEYIDKIRPYFSDIKVIIKPKGNGKSS